MGKCWTCKSYVSTWQFTCPRCQTDTALQKLREKVASGVSELAEVQREGFRELRGTLTTGLTEIASAIEWGFEQVTWELHQQSEALRSIDHTLKTPAETQANEWRNIADKLRQKGVLDEAEKFYLRALESNPLDYQLYIGLAQAYLQGNRFDKAQTYLERSLPHAPKGGIDYRSYSYRLLGHIHECAEDYVQAAKLLRSAIELSPNYAEGQYDYARYCAQTQELETCLSSLQNAISAEPMYWYLAQEERTFDPVRKDVQEVLKEISKQVSISAQDTIAKSHAGLTQAELAISNAKLALAVSRDKTTLESASLYKKGKSNIEEAKLRVSSTDLVSLRDALELARTALDLASKAKDAADGERLHYYQRRQEKINKFWESFGMGMLSAIFFVPAGGTIGCTVGLAQRPREEDAGLLVGAAIGLVASIILALWLSKQELEEIL